MADREGLPGWVWLLAVLLLVGIPVTYKPRGIRNNNPGNLRPLPGADKWQGQVALDTAGGGPFVIFGQAKDGIRALARLLLNYQRKYGLATPAAIIERYAPPSENDTGEYAGAVADALGLKVGLVQKLKGVKPQDLPVDLVDDPAQHLAFVKAIIKHENGMMPYTDAELQAGVQAARA